MLFSPDSNLRSVISDRIAALALDENIREPLMLTPERDGLLGAPEHTGYVALIQKLDSRKLLVHT